MKRVSISLLVLSGIVFFLFWIGNQMTPAPGASSGNGNPAILLFLLLVPLFLVIVFHWVHLLKVYMVPAAGLIIGILVIAGHHILAFLYQYHRLEEYRDVIRQVLMDRGGGLDENYVQAITTGMSIHINNQFFNVNTFFMFLTASLLFAVLYVLLDVGDERKRSPSA